MRRTRTPIGDPQNGGVPTLAPPESVPPEDNRRDRRTARSRNRKPRRPLDRDARRYFVYRMYDTPGRCIYIGRSCDVVARLRMHGSDSPWIVEAVRITMAGLFTWDEARAEEWAAITEAQPVHNKLGTQAWMHQRYPNIYRPGR